VESLDRFVAAQEPVYAEALAELRRGRKESHWMWFIFPQLKGLGRSPTARLYGIDGRDEATAYLRHPLLGARLLECTETAMAHAERSAEQIFGAVDAMKFRSSMTLFEAVAEEPHSLAAALQSFFSGVRDEATLRLLQSSAPD
jgi:uncharacterized protein (DUF1810 family)